MSNITPSAIAAHIAVVDGQLTTTTLDIAEVFGKRHDNVLRAVYQRMNEVDEEWCHLNFEGTVINRPNPGGGAPLQSPVIRMTKKGFALVVQKFNGAKATRFQVAYVDEFERMEQALRARPAQLESTQRAPAPKPLDLQITNAIALTVYGLEKLQRRTRALDAVRQLLQVPIPDGDDTNVTDLHLQHVWRNDLAELIDLIVEATHNTIDLSLSSAETVRDWAIDKPAANEVSA
jgi:Rha family phage regulatory protein